MEDNFDAVNGVDLAVNDTLEEARIGGMDLLNVDGAVALECAALEVSDVDSVDEETILTRVRLVF